MQCASRSIYFQKPGTTRSLAFLSLLIEAAISPPGNETASLEETFPWARHQSSTVLHWHHVLLWKTLCPDAFLRHPVPLSRRASPTTEQRRQLLWSSRKLIQRLACIRSVWLNLFLFLFFSRGKWGHSAFVVREIRDVIGCSKEKKETTSR